MTPNSPKRQALADFAAAALFLTLMYLLFRYL